MEGPWFNPDLEPDQFRKIGYRTIDIISDYFSRLDVLDVYPPTLGEEVERVFDAPLPELGEDPHDIIDDWTRLILPYATHVGSPRYFGFVNGSGSMIATLAEALASSVNMNPGAWKPAPAATEIERRCLRWLAELIGYDTACGGLLTSGGTMANLTALTTALRSVASYDISLHGLQGANTGRFRLYIADHEGHISISRAASLTGLGRNAVRRVASTYELTMDPDALRDAIQSDLDAGDTPFCVVGQVGSVNTGAIDPLNEIADVCDEFGLWFHADGASGAVGAMLPELTHLYEGMNRADSITLDPHKWLYIPYECGGVLVKDAEKLRAAFSMTAPYLRGSTPTVYDGLDFLEYGPQMSRGFRALKLWMTLRHYGASGYRQLLRQNIECARYLYELVEESEDFETVQPPSLFIYSFRYSPSALADDQTEWREEQLDRLNQQIADAIQLDGVAFLMTSRIRGRIVLRVSICSHRTTKDDVLRVFEAIDEVGQNLPKMPTQPAMDRPLSEQSPTEALRTSKMARRSET